MGLEEEVYRTTCSNVLAIDPLPNISQVYAIMMREEQQSNSARGKEVRVEAMVFAARPNPTKGYVNEKEKQRLCEHCGKHGHEIDGCFKLIRYLESYTEKYGDKGCGRRDNGRGRSSHGGGKSGTASNGSGRGRGLPQVNAAVTTPRIGLSAAGKIVTNQGNFPNLSSEGWATLMNFVKS